MNNHVLGRRNFMLAAGSLALTAASTGAMAAGGHKHHHGLNNEGLTKSSAHCLLTGNACIAHCLILLGDGDTDMAECAQSVQLMMSMCEAVSYHAAADSKYLKSMVATCQTICEDCEDACRKHEDKHVECKDCATSCADMVTACKAYLKTA